MSKIMLYIVIICLLAVIVGPLIFMFVWATWDEKGIFKYPPKARFGPYTKRNAEFLLDATKTPYRFAFFNTILISLINTLVAVFFCSLSGFAFAKYKFKGKEILFVFLLATMTIPFQIRLVPLFIIMVNLKWVDSYLAVTIPTIANAFGVFLMRNSIFATVPDELLDAARIDGMSEYGIYGKIVVPVAIPAIAAFATITFMASWNSFVWPMIILRSREKQVLTTTLSTMIQSLPTGALTEWPYGPAILGSVVSLIPPMIVFFALQKYFITGIMTGAIKS